MTLLAQSVATACLAIGLVSLAAATARAQAPAQAPAARSRTSPPRSTWRLGLVADATWYDNAYFVLEPGTETWSTGGRVSLEHGRRFQSGTFSIHGYGGKIYYPDYRDYDHANYGGALSLETGRPERTLFRLSQTYDHTDTRQIELDPESPPLPLSRLDSATTLASLTSRVSRSWQLGLDGSFNLRRYSSSNLVDGDQLQASAQAARIVGRSSAWYLSYGYLSAWFDSGDYRAHQALLGYRRKPDRGVQVDLAGGAAYVEAAGRFFPAGSASLGARGRRASFTLSYRRDFGQAYGYGKQTIGDLGAATFDWEMATRLRLSAAYSYGYRRAAEDLEQTIRSQIASGGLAWGLTKDLEISARYSWERNQTDGQPAYDLGRVIGSLSYGVDWR